MQALRDRQDWSDNAAAGKILASACHLRRFLVACAAFRLSAAEEEELENVLEMETIGQRNYYNRKAIVVLIETIAELTEHTIPFFKEIGLQNGKP